MNRRETVLMLRPEINCSDNGDTKALEQFTNTTLRPILKFQHIVLCTLIQAERHLDWELLNEANQDRKTDYFTDFVKKNNNLKNTLIGMTIALFSKQETSEAESTSTIVKVCKPVAESNAIVGNA
mgnify:CR=1 FL=1